MTIVFLSGCSNVFNKSSADWAFYFVVWDGYIYQLSDDYVDNITLNSVTNGGLRIRQVTFWKLFEFF